MIAFCFEDKLYISKTTSSKPGGQHVNKSKLLLKPKNNLI